MTNLNPEDVEDITSFEKCRNIHKEIIDFGVSQKELVKLIELLSLELEDITLMKQIANIIKSNPSDECESKNLQKTNNIIY